MESPRAITLTVDWRWDRPIGSAMTVAVNDNKAVKVATKVERMLDI